MRLATKVLDELSARVDPGQSYQLSGSRAKNERASGRCQWPLRNETCQARCGLPKTRGFQFFRRITTAARKCWGSTEYGEGYQ